MYIAPEQLRFFLDVNLLAAGVLIAYLIWLTIWSVEYIDDEDEW